MNPETDKIYNIAFDLIEQRLNKKEQVFPFSVVLEQAQLKPTLNMYEPVTKNTAEQLDVIRNDLRKMIKNEEIAALCLCYDVQTIDPRTNQKTDAIQIELANGDEDAVNIYIPYDFEDSEIIKKPFQTRSDQKYFIN